MAHVHGDYPSTIRIVHVSSITCYVCYEIYTSVHVVGSYIATEVFGRRGRIGMRVL